MLMSKLTAVIAGHQPRPDPRPGSRRSGRRPASGPPPCPCRRAAPWPRRSETRSRSTSGSSRRPSPRWSRARSSSGAPCSACRRRWRSRRGRRAGAEARPRLRPRTRGADLPPGRSCGTRPGRRGAGREHRPSLGTLAVPTSARAGADRPTAARPAPARRRTRPRASSCATERPCGWRSRSSVCLLWRVVNELAHALDALAPQLLVTVEQAPRDAEPLEVGADDLPPPAAVLSDEARPLEDGDVLLHRREAHRVVRGQLGYALLPVDRAAHDVAPGGVTQCAEDAVVVEGDLQSYNHTVVCTACQVFCEARQL